MSADVGDAVAKLEAVAAALRHVKDAGGEATVTVDKNTSAMSKMDTAAKDAAKSMDAAGRAIGGDSNDSFASHVKTAENAMADTEKAIRDARNAVADADLAWVKSGRLLEKFGMDGEKATKDVGKGFYDVGHAIDSVSEKMQGFFGSNTTRGPFGALLKGLGNILRIPLEIGSLFAKGAQGPPGGLTGLFGALGIGEQEVGTLSTGLGSLAASAGIAAGALAAVGAAMVTVAAVAGIAAAAVTALADTLGTGLVILQSLLGPVALLTTLLGGLGFAFFYIAKNDALKPHGALWQSLGQLHDQFKNLQGTLMQRFMPAFRFLISSASEALHYLNAIAKLPLAEAFHQIATTGVRGFKSFLDQIGSFIAHPIRLAIKIAFGQSGPVTNLVNDLFTQIQNYLFGYTRTHQIHIGRFLGPATTTEVKGALQPFLNWWNRQNFTARGIELGHDLMDGLMHSGLAHNLGQFLIKVLEDAAKTGMNVFVQVFKAELNIVEGYARSAWNAIRNAFRTAVGAIRSALITVLGPAVWSQLAATARQTWNTIKLAGQVAWRAISDAAKVVWDILKFIYGVIKTIVGAVILVGTKLGIWKGALDFFRGAISGVLSAFQDVLGVVDSILGGINAAVGAAEALAGALGSASNSAPSNPHGNPRGGAPGQVAGRPGGHLARRNVTINIHGADLSTAAHRRIVAQQLGDELMRVWSARAGIT